MITYERIQKCGPSGASSEDTPLHTRARVLNVRHRCGRHRTRPKCGE